MGACAERAELGSSLNPKSSDVLLESRAKPVTSAPPESAKQPEWREFQLSASEVESAFADKNKYLARTEDINRRFSLVKQFSGKSDSFIYEVVCNNKLNNIFKVLPPSDSLSLHDNIAFKELFFVYQLSSLKSKKYISGNQNASIFFPKISGMGFVKSSNPFEEIDKQEYYPFYVMEKINGITLLDLVMQPELAKSILGYDYYSADPRIFYYILLQLSIAMLNANSEIGFIHNDLHPSNILLSTEKVPMDFQVGNTKIKTAGPLIKIIDFDQGEIPSLRPTNRRVFKTWGRKILGVIGPSKDFYKAINPQGNWQVLTFSCYNSSPNMDLFMLNILIHCFSAKLLENGVDIDSKYFSSLQSFIDYLVANEAFFR